MADLKRSRGVAIQYPKNDTKFTKNKKTSNKYVITTYNWKPNYYIHRVFPKYYPKLQDPIVYILSEKFLSTCVRFRDTKNGRLSFSEISNLQ